MIERDARNAGGTAISFTRFLSRLLFGGRPIILVVASISSGWPPLARLLAGQVGQFRFINAEKESGVIMTDLIQFPRRPRLKSIEDQIFENAQNLVYFYAMVRRGHTRRLSLGELVQASFERLHMLEELPALSIFALQMKTEALLELMADPHSDPIGIIPRLTQVVLENIMAIRNADI